MGRFTRVLLVLFTLAGAAGVALWRSDLARPGAAVAVAAAERGRGAGEPGAIAAASPGARDDAAQLEYLRSLEAEHLRAVREIADVYWAAGGTFQSAYTEAFAGALASIREDFARRFGAGVKDDPAYRWLYRPLDPLYRFLSSDEQIAIQQLRFERDSALQAAARDAGRAAGSAGGGGAVNEAAALAILREYQAGLAALLDPETLLEFELRDSAVAGELRASGIELDEREFRRAYALMAALQEGSAAADDGVAVREELRNLLGSRRYAELRAARDPLFAEISAIAERHTLPDAMRWSVYELMDEFQDRRLDLAQSSGADPARAAQDALALADDERAALARLVGEEVADEIVRGRALLSFRLFGSAGRPPQSSDSRESQGGRFR